MYQGHLPDGSSVQRHSAGPLYPYVVVCRDSADGLVYSLIGPGIPDELPCSSFDAIDGIVAKLRALGADGKAAYAAIMQQLSLDFGKTLLQSAANKFYDLADDRLLPSSMPQLLGCSPHKRIESVIAAMEARLAVATGAAK